MKSRWWVAILLVCLSLAGCGGLLWPDPPKVEVNMNTGNDSQNKDNTDNTAEPFVYTVQPTE